MFKSSGNVAMHPLREAVKRELLARGDWCILCGKKATDLHEIICPNMGGDKYHPDNEELARAVYVKENCAFLCPVCNRNFANSLKTKLLKLNMKLYCVESVVTAMRNIAQYLKVPEAYIPATIIFEGKEVKVL